MVYAGATEKGEKKRCLADGISWMSWMMLEGGVTLVRTYGVLQCSIIVRS